MTIRTPRIGEFKDLSGTAEIVGLGRVRQPSGGAQEVECQVLLAVDMDQPSFDPSTQTSTRWIGCGQLDLLKAGSFWRVGTYAGDARTDIRSGAFLPSHDEPLGLGASRQPSGSRPFPSLGIHDAPCFLLAQFEEASGKDHRRSILLPKMELIRCLFGVGNDVLLELFDGLRSSPIAPDRSSIDRPKCSYDGEDSVVLVSSRDLSDDKALVVAAILYDKKMRALHRSVYQQLSVDPDMRDGRPTYVNIAWPWSDPVQMKVAGRWIERANSSRRFLVCRIDEIAIPLPFSNIEVRHTGSSRTIDLGLPASTGRMRLSNAARSALVTGMAATSSRQPLTVATGASGMIDRTGIVITHVDVGAGGRGEDAVIGEERRDEAYFGTGGRMEGADPEIGAANTGRGRTDGDALPPRSIEEALAKTWAAIESASARQKWKMVALPRHGAAKPGTPFGGLDFAREPLVVSVSTDRSRLLVADRGSPSGDEVSLGILIPRNSEEDARTLAKSARKICGLINGRWRSPRCNPSDFKVISMNRSQTLWEDDNAFRDAIARKLAKALETAG